MIKRISLHSLKNVSIDSSGLNDDEVLFQQTLYGKNLIHLPEKPVWLSVLRDSLKDPMVYFLLFLGAIFALLQNYQESIVLLLAIIPLLLMDVFLHWRAKSATKMLTEELSGTVLVVRNGQDKVIGAHDLVPGDLVRLSPGMTIPADGLVEDAMEIKVDESALTGESFPHAKKSYPLTHHEKDTLGEISLPQNSYFFAGTRILTGQALCRILATGQHTSYGEILHSLSQISHDVTPLQKNIEHLVKNLMMGAVIFCIFLIFIRWYQGFGWIDAFISGATLAIAAIPEEFPMVFTFFLGLGVYRLAKKGALVKRAVSVENIGRVTHICTDKTGTLTRGELELTHVLGNQEVLSAAIYASNPDLNDPLDLAIFRYAKQQNITLDLSTVIKRYPFTEDRKKETVQLLQHTFSKGAPETIFNLCTMDAQSRKSWENTVSTLAKQGHKVLAVAKRDCEDIDFLREDAADFTLLGLLAFEDPPRPEVKEAITYCHNQGIKVLMITGDHPDTALAIGSEIGLGEKVLNAESEFSFFENGSWDFIQSIDIVARCTPMQKLKIVNRLKQDKKIVVVTGDGVNDVPALKTAHIGVVMGLRGVRSAKEVSSIIISDDNFATIIAAIQEGKKLFYNLKLSFHYLLLVHIPLVLISALVPLLGYPLVFSPIQIVLLELLIHPSAFLGFQGEVNFFSSKDLQLFPLKDVLKIIGSGVFVSFILLSCYILLIQYSQKNLVQVRDIIVSLLMLWSGLSVLHLNRYKNSTAYIVALCSLIASWIIFKGYFF